jgi:hypothetical protein
VEFNTVSQFGVPRGFWREVSEHEAAIQPVADIDPTVPDGSQHVTGWLLRPTETQQDPQVVMWRHRQQLHGWLRRTMIVTTRPDMDVQEKPLSEQRVRELTDGCAVHERIGRGLVTWGLNVKDGMYESLRRPLPEDFNSLLETYRQGAEQGYRLPEDWYEG